jgi:DNA invertase Pin-like site-specific DNA recombinase
MMIQENVLSTPDIDGVVCFHQSRVSRNTGELCTFADAVIKAGKHIKIADDPNLDIYNSGDYFKFTIVSAMDRKDRADIVVKMQNGRKVKASNGGYAYGSPQFGMQSVNKVLVANDEELASIDVIRRHRKSGKSFAKIADYLNTEGIRTKRGKQWHASSVSNVYKRLMAKPA